MEPLGLLHVYGFVGAVLPTGSALAHDDDQGGGVALIERALIGLKALCSLTRSGRHDGCGSMRPAS